MRAVSGTELENSRLLRLWLDSDCPDIQTLTARVYDAVGGEEAVKQKPALAHRHLKVVLLNLLSIAASDGARFCAYSRTRNFYAAKSRYNPLCISHGLIDVVDVLAATGMIEHHAGFLDRVTGIGRRSRMRATDKFLSVVPFEAEDVPRLIQVPANLESIKLYPPKVEGKRHPPIEYQDTGETHRMRAVLSDYNYLLERTHIDVQASEEEMALSGKDKADWPLQGSDKRLYRVFNDGRWDHGGRFYGGLWESLPKALRERICIDGRPTLELDFSAIHIRLLYGLRGINYRKDIHGDAYRLGGWEQSDRMRAVLKKAILTGVNASSFDSAVRGLRKALSHDKPQFSWVFDEGVNLKALLNAMIDKHEQIADCLFSGQGICLQYLDSQITERLLIAAMTDGLVLLPIHDSYIVDQIHGKWLDYQMERCLREILDKETSENLRDEHSTIDIAVENMATRVTKEGVYI